MEKGAFKSPPSGYRVPTTFFNAGLRKAPADCADFIIPTIEITTGKVNVSLLERADYADYSLLSGANLRNQRFPTANYDINGAFFYESTDKICGICGNLRKPENLGND